MSLLRWYKCQEGLYITAEAQSLDNTTKTQQLLSTGAKPWSADEMPGYSMA